MSKYGLKFERKEEACEELLKTHHIYLSDDKRSFVRDETKHHNILIEGENLHALKILSYTHAGKIDVIYVDPPYNTGNKDFVYNDAFVDEEDSFRHSKWLSFMEKRLKIARSLLSERGVIFISIDDNEQANLKLLCDEVFGEKSFVGNFTWETKRGAKGVPPRNLLVFTHEYVLCYCKTKDGEFSFRGDDRSDEDFDNPDNDPRGLWRSESITATGKQDNYFDIINPQTGDKHFGNWAFSPGTINKMIAEGKILWPKKKTGKPCQKKFKDTYTNETKSITTALGWYHTETATKELIEMFDGVKVFDHPKPLPLIKYLLKQGSQKDSIILDFFAGSGTTGQAAAELNKEDGGTRQFILITNNDKSDKLPDGICSQVTFPRLEKTIGNENLKVLQVEKLKMKDGVVSKIGQLELNSRLVPTLCLAHNTFIQVEKTKQSTIFTDHKNDLYIGVWSNTDDIQKPPARKELAKFEKKLIKMSKNTKLLVNRPRRGFACEYFEFMKA
jgi:adenine-specific DNA-methyltransferase